MKHFTVDYHRIKTLKIKTYKTQQSVSPINGIIRGKSKQLFRLTFDDPIYEWNRLLGFEGFNV